MQNSRSGAPLFALSRGERAPAAGGWMRAYGFSIGCTPSPHGRGSCSPDGAQRNPGSAPPCAETHHRPSTSRVPRSGAPLFALSRGERAPAAGGWVRAYGLLIGCNPSPHGRGSCSPDGAQRNPGSAPPCAETHHRPSTSRVSTIREACPGFRFAPSGLHTIVAPAYEPGPTRISPRRSASRSAIGSRLGLTAVRDDEKSLVASHHGAPSCC
jgi:hypothetical protein